MLLQRAESRSWSWGCRHTHQLAEDASLVTVYSRRRCRASSAHCGGTETREGLNTHNGGLKLRSTSLCHRQHATARNNCCCQLQICCYAGGSRARGGGACACAHAFVCVRHSRGLNGNKKVAHRKLRRSPRQGKSRQRCWPSVRSARAEWNPSFSAAAAKSCCLALSSA